jgi:hypothetical protein
VAPGEVIGVDPDAGVVEIHRGVAHAHVTEPDAGRRAHAWAHAAGATDVTASASVRSFATA